MRTKNVVTAFLFLITGTFLGAALFAVVSGRTLDPARAAAPRRGDGPAVPAGGRAEAAPGPAEAAAGERASPFGAARGGRAGYADVARAAMPAVVNISSLQVVRTYEYSPFFADPFFGHLFGDDAYGFVVPREQRATSLGSGVVVDDRGTILTSNHVVENAREVKVSTADGRELRARLLGSDARTDLAVLRVEGAGLPHAAMGDSERMEVGDIVLAIGNPFGLGGTVTMGIVSALGRGSLGLADYEDFIQTDAAINPGNSGGALVDTSGAVVGINTAILSRSGGSQGIGFAIPSNMARDVLDSILATGRVVRGYAGVGLQEISPDMARALGMPEVRGALVAALDPAGPASAAGLRRGDVVVALAGRPVVSAAELRTHLSRLKPGDTARLEVARGARRFSLDLGLVEPPAPRQERTRRG